MPSNYEIRYTLGGKRYACLADDPDTLCEINEDFYETSVGSGLHPSNALNYAIEAPFRVTQGFGVVINFATLEAALACANENSDDWLVRNGRRNAYIPKGEPLSYDICGPEVEALLDEPIEHKGGWAQRYETIHRPTHGEFIAQRIDDRHREKVSV